MTIDKILESKSERIRMTNAIGTTSDIDEVAPLMIKLSDAKQIIHEALKKQREICAEVYEDFNEDVPENGIKIINKIENAPEPEIGE